ncbi:MAG TPA: heme o synthase [Verrucomicrobiae bacterium]|nr:heme o synthase [Verrucomicrobiae bacterium]
MASQLAALPGQAARERTSQLKDYYSLTKPEVNLLILMATAAGYLLGNRGALAWGTFLQTLTGTLLVASGTATLNQYMERAHDARMRRTSNRPLPAGRLHPREALYFGLLMSAAGGLGLLFAVNALSAGLAIGTLLLYLLLYTPLKRKTSLCTLIGAVPGAMPVLIGWAGASGKLESGAGLLFAILFLWQFPHFLAIALMYREDYERAGYRMLPAFDVEGRFTRLEIIGFSVLLAVVTIVSTGVGGFHRLSSLVMTCLGVLLCYCGVRLARLGSRRAASQLLHASVIYLPAVLALLVSQKY